MRQQKPKSRVLLCLTAVLMMSYQAGVYAQDGSPADAYYNEHLGGDATTSASELPSEAYYNNNILRAGPPGGGPGGSGTGGNGGVGVAPIGEGTTCILVAILGYVLIATGRRCKKDNKHIQTYTLNK